MFTIAGGILLAVAILLLIGVALAIAIAAVVSVRNDLKNAAWTREKWDREKQWLEAQAARKGPWG
jgi:hypothetical protein